MAGSICRVLGLVAVFLLAPLGVSVFDGTGPTENASAWDGSSHERITTAVYGSLDYVDSDYYATLVDACEDPDDDYLDLPNHYAPGAATHARDYSDGAIELFNDNQIFDGYYDLGYSSHYVMDLGNPYHGTLDLSDPAELAIHYAFETAVAQNWDALGLDDECTNAIMADYLHVHPDKDVRDMALYLADQVAPFKSVFDNPSSEEALEAGIKTCVRLSASYVKALYDFVLQPLPFYDNFGDSRLDGWELDYYPSYGSVVEVDSSEGALNVPSMKLYKGSSAKETASASKYIESPGQDDFVVQASIMVSSKSTDWKNAYFILKDGANMCVYFIMRYGTFYYYDGDWRSLQRTYDANVWYHIAFHVKPSTSQYDIYIDGIKANTNPCNFYSSGSSIDTIYFQCTPSGVQKYFTMWVDDVEVVERPLTFCDDFSVNSLNNWVVSEAGTNNHVDPVNTEPGDTNDGFSDYGYCMELQKQTANYDTSAAHYLTASDNGHITIEANVLVNTISRIAYMVPKGDDGSILFYFAFYYGYFSWYNGAHYNYIIGYNANQFYRVSFDMFPSEGVDFYVDGILRAAKLPYYTTGAFKSLLFQADWYGGAGITMWVDDVMIMGATLQPEPNAPPVASFTTAKNGLVVNVDASASYDPDGTISSYAWTWGDGTSTGPSTSKTASHTYGVSGTYTIVLTVTDNKGGTGTTSASVTVTNLPPTASFTKTLSGWWVNVDAGGSSDPDGYISTYAWLWGDGLTSTVSSPKTSHHYTSAGTFTIRLTVTDNAGGTATTTQSVTTTADTTGPTTTITLYGEHYRNQYVPPVTVEITASDSQSGVASIWYRIGTSGSFTRYTTMLAFQNLGSYTIQAYSIDIAGNVGKTTSVSFKIVAGIPV